MTNNDFNKYQLELKENHNQAKRRAAGNNVYKK
jgi:hypothetical protein